MPIGTLMIAIVRQGAGAGARLQPAQGPPPAHDERCIGGQATLPYEQNTQQCPGSGRSTAPHARHGCKTTQASVGMVSTLVAPHRGQVKVD